MKDNSRLRLLLDPACIFKGNRVIISFSSKRRPFLEAIKKIGKSLLIGSLAGLAIALVTNYFVADLIDRLEDQTYYMRYRWEFEDLPSAAKVKAQAKQQETDYGIHIIDIDDRSQHKLGVYWNWDRSFHADMIRNLSKHYPAALVFDVLFYDPEDQNQIKRLDKLIERSKETNPNVFFPDQVRHALSSSINYDKQFIDATREAGNVFHALCMADKKDYPDYALSQIEHKMTMEWNDSLHPSSTILLPPEKKSQLFDRKPVLDGTFPQLAQAARDIGFVNIPKNKDGVIREIPLLYSFGSQAPVYLPISVRTAATLFGTPNKEIIFEPRKYVDIGKPFKIFKDSLNRITYSYPNVTAELIKAVLDHSGEIIAPTGKER